MNVPVFSLLRRTISEFGKRSGLSLAASISFYTILSISPIFVLILWLARLIGVEDRERLVAQVSAQTGEHTADFVRSLLANIQSQPSLADLAGIASFGLLLVSAGGVFGQLQASLNSIWDVKAKPKFSLLGWLKKRATAMAMVLLLGVFIAASLLTTSLTGFFAELLGGSEWVKVLIEVTNTALSLVLFSVFFAALFRYLPDRTLEWRDVRLGGFLTALMFVVGKLLIGLYLGYSSVGSAFGAAGSLAVFLIWVYYSAAIFLFGAELTQQLAVGPHKQQEPLAPRWHDPVHA